MKKCTFLFLGVLLVTFLIAEEKKEYDKKLCENDRKENEIVNITNPKEKNELKEKNTKNNYFTKMYVEKKINWRKSNFYTGKFNSYILASYYETFLSFSNTSKASLSIRFSPVLMNFPKKHYSPVLSLYLGNFNTPQSFCNVYKPVIFSIKAIGNSISFPALNAIKISKKNNDEGIALEVSLPFFNYYSFWKNTKKGNIFNTYISYKNKFSNSSFLNIAIISSIQEIKKEKLKKNPYIQIYGLDFNFAHHFFYINGLSLLTVLPKKSLSFSSVAFRNELALLLKFFSLHSGISYKGAYYLGNQNLQELLQGKTYLSFYLQGKFRYKIFYLNSTYHLLKDYKLPYPLHSYDISYSLSKKIISYKNEFFYKNYIYKIKFVLNITPNLNYFKIFSISTFLYLQDIKINPQCIKKYQVLSKCDFKIGKNLSLKFSFSTIQEKKNWNELRIFTSIALNFDIAEEKIKKRGEVKLKYDNKKEGFELYLKFRIEY